jgi:hypothetical protein
LSVAVIPCPPPGTGRHAVTAISEQHLHLQQVSAHQLPQHNHENDGFSADAKGVKIESGVEKTASTRWPVPELVARRLPTGLSTTRKSAPVMEPITTFRDSASS